MPKQSVVVKDSLYIYAQESHLIKKKNLWVLYAYLKDLILKKSAIF